MTKMVTAESGATFDSDPLHIPARCRVAKRVVQVEISDAANVDIEGRVDDDAPWELINQFTNNGYLAITLFPQMRVSIDSNTGTVNVWVDDTRP